MKNRILALMFLLTATFFNIRSLGISVNIDNILYWREKANKYGDIEQVELVTRPVTYQSTNENVIAFIDSEDIYRWIVFKKLHFHASEM